MKLENNLDTDRIRELVWKLAFPSMLAQFVSVLYSIVDRMYIGNIPEIGGQALAAVGVCGPVVTLITSFASWVGIGGAPIMSIRLGQKNEKAAQNVVANCFVLLAVMAAVLMTVMYLFKNQLLTVFGAGSAIFPYADEYLTWYLSGTAFALLSTGMNQFIICQGFAKVGMMTVLLGAVSNIILDPVFIFVLDLGVKGAAIATVLSQLASCVYVLFFLLGKRPLVRITFWRISKGAYGPCIGTGPVPLFDHGFRQRPDHYYEYADPPLWKLRNGRCAFDLQYHRAEFYADDHYAAGRNYRRHADYFGV